MQPESDLIPLSRYGRAEATELELNEAEEARLEELSDKYDALVESLEEEPDDAVSRELDQLSAEISALESKKEGWADEEKARAGAIVSLAADGTLKVFRGLIKANGNCRTPANENGEPQTKAPRRNGYSDSVLLELSAHRTVALQETVASQPENALLMLMHALVDQLFYNGPSGSCLRVVANPVSAPSGCRIRLPTAKRCRRSRHGTGSGATVFRSSKTSGPGLWPWMRRTGCNCSRSAWR